MELIEAGTNVPLEAPEEMSVAGLESEEDIFDGLVWKGGWKVYFLGRVWFGGEERGLIWKSSARRGGLATSFTKISFSLPR